MSRPTIALCMIVKNAESNLPRVLESVQGCVDEIHITDTGSTDRTVDVAKALGCQVHYFEWINDFAAARNYSFSHTKCDYILWLDDDDVLAGKDKFLQWRNTAMETANYWLANYHYTLDQAGRPVCTFMRERVVKNIPEHKWKYFIHEGIMGVPGVTHSGVVASWSVMHMRSAEDMKQDRSRNVTIFERKMDEGQELDGRMKYYYAKELFENCEPKSAVKWFYKALEDKNLELHDRILAMQYLIYSLSHLDELKRKMGNNEGSDIMQAISLAHQALVLDPHRAEFHCAIGDAYVKLGKLVDAIPFYSAAKQCVNRNNNGSGISGPIFTFGDLYDIHPRVSLAKIYFQIGKIQEAENEISGLAVSGHPEGTALLAELKKIKALNFNAVEPEDDNAIVISCPPGGMYEWDEKIYHEKGIGGSETAAVEMARNLHKVTGKKVIVFNSRPTDLELDGVHYVSNSKLNDYFSKFKPRLHIAWRHSIKVTNAPTYLWAHDLIVSGMENISNYEGILTLSQFQKDYIMSMYPMIPESKIIVTRNGLSPEKFVGLNVENKQKGKIVFPSSPDRGLKEAMLICDEVIKEVPELELHVFYGFGNIEKSGHEPLIQKAALLKKMMSERPYVKFHGNTEQKALMKHFSEAEAWVYPADWYETFCITAFECLASKCYPVLRPVGALRSYMPKFAELGYLSMIDMALDDPKFIPTMAEETTKAIKEQRWKNMSFNIADWSWESLAKDWADRLIKES